MNPLRILPAPLHRLAYRLAHRARGLWYARTRQTVHGCSVIAQDESGRILLVRHSYGPATWTFPGGGIRRHETPMCAAKREFGEELQCNLRETRRVDTLEESFFGATNVVHIFTGLVDGQPRPDRREIVEARFFARDEFPSNLSRWVPARMAALDAASAERPEGHKLQQR